MAKRRLMFESNSKKYFEGPEPGSLIQNFSEGADGVGVLNHRLCEYFLQGLSSVGIATHFIKRLNMHESLIHHLEMVPVSVKVRLRADEDYANRMGFPLATIFSEPLLEVHYRNKEGVGTQISLNDLSTLGVMNDDEIDDFQTLIGRVTDYLAGLYWSAGCLLVDYHLEVGRQYFDDYPPMLVVTDEIGPQNAQIWDLAEDGARTIVKLEVSDIADRLSLSPQK